MPAAQHSRSPVRLGWYVLTIAVMAALWLLMVGSFKWHELVVGVFAVALTAVFMGVVFSQEQRELAFCAADLWQLRRAPGEVLRGVWTLLVVLACDFAGRRAGSWFVWSGIRTAKDDPQLASRRVLAILYGSISPDTVVLGVDYTQSRMLLHQLRRAPLSETLRALGAR